MTMQLGMYCEFRLGLLRGLDSSYCLSQGRSCLSGLGKCDKAAPFADNVLLLVGKIAQSIAPCGARR